MTGKSGDEADALLECYFAVQGYLRISKLYDDRFVTYAEMSQSEVFLKLFCGPSYLLQQAGKTTAPAYFSRQHSCRSDIIATCWGRGRGLQPLDSLSFSSEQWMFEFYRYRRDSGSGAQQRGHRPDAECAGSGKAGKHLDLPAVLSLHAGYYEAFARMNPGAYLAQGHGMSEEEREAFLNAFQADAEVPLIGFAVMGGIFSEGIDLKGERLSSVVVIGVGLPQLSFENDIIKDYFDRTGKRGYDYAYVYPGMNKVFAGRRRLIRSEQDSGTLTLVDDRFLNRQYGIFGRRWRHYRRI